MKDNIQFVFNTIHEPETHSVLPGSELLIDLHRLGVSAESLLGAGPEADAIAAAVESAFVALQRRFWHEPIRRPFVIDRMEQTIRVAAAKLLLACKPLLRACG